MTEDSGSAGTPEVRSGVFLKRIRDGYTWSIAVAASGPSEPEMLEAVRVAEVVDVALAEKYPRPVDPVDAEAEKRAAKAARERERRAAQKAEREAGLS